MARSSYAWKYWGPITGDFWIASMIVLGNAKNTLFTEFFCYLNVHYSKLARWYCLPLYNQWAVEMSKVVMSYHNPLTSHILQFMIKLNCIWNNFYLDLFWRERESLNWKQMNWAQQIQQALSAMIWFLIRMNSSAKFDRRYLTWYFMHWWGWILYCIVLHCIAN